MSRRPDHDLPTRHPPGGVIEHIEPGSVGAQARLRPGDRLLAIDGHRLRDVIDVQFYGADEVLELLVERAGRRHTIVVERDYDQEMGLTFAHPTFDADPRRCANNCDFCFVKQNPRGLRRSLYIKDDDYRHAFLFGNFVTLTNLTEPDWARLAEQRLSPLYVSVHATDLELRRRFLRRPDAPDIVDQLRRLGKLGIEVHTQVVLVPGLNDGQHLARTVEDLAGLYDDPVASVGIVPIGLTRYHRGSCRPYTAGEARDVLDAVEKWHAAFRHRWAVGFVYASDEWYLTAGRPVPPAEAYDDFAQIENGVGMVRQLLDEWASLKKDLRRGKAPRPPLAPATLVCGTLIAPVLQRIVAQLAGLTGADWQVLPVVNQFWGAVTTVSGLLTAQDVIAALHDQPAGRLVLLPRSMFTGRYGAGTAPPDTTLDDLPLTEIAARLGRPVAMAGTLREALEQAQAAAGE